MNTINIEKILNKHRDGELSLAEATKLLTAVGVNVTTPVEKETVYSEKVVNLPWEDDEKVRIVVFRGKRLLTKGEADQYNIEVKFHGGVHNVDCAGNLYCGNIDGSVMAGGSVSCGNVDGSVNAGSSISCGDVDGDANAGTELKCGDIDGNVNAGANIYCGHIDGSVFAGGSVNVKK